MMTALTISDDKPIENIQNVSRIVQMKKNFIFFLFFFACWLSHFNFLLSLLSSLGIYSETNEKRREKKWIATRYNADNQMNTIGKTPEEQFLFPQSIGKKSKRTELAASFSPSNSFDSAVWSCDFILFFFFLFSAWPASNCRFILSFLHCRLSFSLLILSDHFDSFISFLNCVTIWVEKLFGSDNPIKAK